MKTLLTSLILFALLTIADGCKSNPADGADTMSNYVRCEGSMHTGNQLLTDRAGYCFFFVRHPPDTTLYREYVDKSECKCN